MRVLTSLYGILTTRALPSTGNRVELSGHNMFVPSLAITKLLAGL